MPGKFIKIVLPLSTAAAFIGTIKSQAKPSIAYTESTDMNQWIKINNGLGVNDVGRSCGGV